MADEWMYALGLGTGLFGSAKSKNKKQQKKYEENRRRAMEAYQRELEQEAAGLEAAYAPTGAEQANVLRRYGISGEVGGPRQLYTELDPELAGLYRQRTLEELQQPDIRYQESVDDIMSQIARRSGGVAIGRGVFRSGLHAQDYAQRALQELVPFRMQAITNALNRGDELTRVFENMRRQAVGEYEPVRGREVAGRTQAANLRAQGAASRYGTEADIAAGNVNRYLGREAAVSELIGKAAGAALQGATGAPTRIPQGGINPNYISYMDSQLETPSFYSQGGFSPEEFEIARMRSSRERNPYGLGGGY